MMSTNSQELLELAVLAALNALAWSHHAQVHLALIPVPAPLKLVKRTLQNRWKCIPHHVVNEHRWTDTDGKRHHCDHAPLTAEEQKKRMWLKKDSVAYQDLMSLVFDKRLLKDLQKMALFKHTGPLEIFHRALLKYLPKCQAFSYEGGPTSPSWNIMRTLWHENKPPRQQENHASSRSSAKSQSNG
ncbi:hypothetical protein AALO_G00203080 [Alosa alosa]|uniref:Uncharacterized protein n=1 Tax=Alosa alosa TaxID=278164 RepID=A0AAV6G3A4_9TELE|nr:hypothetical protein AALO_G00203080 [Alosa alosa]